MDLTALGEFISRIGFPVSVAIYLLWFTTRHINDNTAAMRELRDVISKLCDKLGGK